MQKYVTVKNGSFGIKHENCNKQYEKEFDERLPKGLKIFTGVEKDTFLLIHMQT